MATFIVTTLNDENDASASVAAPGGTGLSLREALALANGTAGIDEISFAAGAGEAFETGGTIRLTQGELVATEAVTITGLTDTDGNPLIRITGDANGDDVLDADGNTDVAASGAGLLDDNSRVLNVATTDADATLYGLIITGGRTTAAGGDGGGIRALGTLDLINATVSGNSTSGYGARGGGIVSNGDTNLINATVSGNSTSGGFGLGGGIYSNGDTNLINATVSGNSTSGDDSFGGGLFSRVNTTLTNATVSGNSTGGDGAVGGGIVSLGGTTLTNSTVSGNSTSGVGADGGGIFSVDNTTLTNSTVSGNSTIGDGADGGGIYSREITTLTNSTVSGNSTSGNAAEGGGISSVDNINLTNSIVLGNDSAQTGLDEIDNFNGSTTGNGLNIVGVGADTDASDAIINASSVGDVFAIVDPVTGGGLLADNGGPVETVLILAGGLAQNAGNASLLPLDTDDLDGDGNTSEPLPVDARGETRVVGASVDLGAVELQNSPPMAEDDMATVNEDGLVGIIVLDNDSDPDFDLLSVILVDGVTAMVNVPIMRASGAEVTLLADRTLAYAPAADFFGGDSFTYTISDGNGETDQATVSVTVNPVNDVPTFSLGADQTVLEDAGAQTVAAFAIGSVGPANEAGQALSYLVTTDNDALFDGTPTISGDGTLSYTPASNRNGTATITVIAMDNGGTANGGVDTSAASTFTITIDPVNDAPQFSLAGDQTVDEDAGPQTVAGFAIGSVGPANEAGQSLSYMVTTDNPGLFAVAPSISAEGMLTYETAPDVNGTAMITVTAMDDGGIANGGEDTSAAQVFMLTVNPVNDAPVAIDNDFMIGESDFLDNGRLLMNDMDVDGDTLTIVEATANGVSRPAETTPYNVTTVGGRTATVFVGNGLAASGIDFLFNTAGNFEDLGLGETDSLTFTYTISDGEIEDEATVTITITGENDLPADGDETETVSEDGPPLVVNLLDNAMDVDASDVLTAGGLASVTPGGIGGLQPDGTFTFDPGADFQSLREGQTATVSFDYTVSDGNGGEDLSSITITVEGANDGPTAADDMAVTDENVGVIIDVLNNDTDPDTGVDPAAPPMMPMTPPVGDTLSVTMIAGQTVMAGDSVILESGAIVTLLADGTIDYDPDGQFDSLRFGEVAADSFTYSIADDFGAMSTATVNVTIAGRGTNVPDGLRDMVDERNDNALIVGSSDGFFGTDADDVISGANVMDVIFGRDGDDRIVANNGSDIVFGDAGMDTITGGGRGDSLFGGEDDDRVDGGGGADVLFGDDGDDIILGRGGNDEIMDGAGNDQVFAKGGNDRVFLDLGNDTIALGKGRDTIIAEDDGFGMDVVTDFNLNQDRLDLRLLGLETAAQARALATQVGSDIVFDFGSGDTLTLENRTLANLSDSAFVIDPLIMI